MDGAGSCSSNIQLDTTEALCLRLAVNRRVVWDDEEKNVIIASDRVAKIEWERPTSVEHMNTISALYEDHGRVTLPAQGSSTFKTKQTKTHHTRRRSTKAHYDWGWCWRLDFKGSFLLSLRSFAARSSALPCEHLLSGLEFFHHVRCRCQRPSIRLSPCLTTGRQEAYQACVGWGTGNGQARR